jgi:transposase/IS5 family transposase
MRGKNDEQQAMMFVVSMEELVPKDHPIRAVKKLADAELARLDSAFERLYGKTGRPSIPPERLLKGSLLMALFSIRSERQLCEQLGYNFLYRWFLDMGVNEEPFDASGFAKNRVRLLNEEIARQFFAQIVNSAREHSLLSSEHFTVDGTLIEANASLKSFKRKDRKDDDQPPSSRNESVDFHGEKRANDTHASTTDAEARLYKKGPGKEARLSYSAHVLMENRNGLCVDISVARADGHAEVDEGLKLIQRQQRQGVGLKTVGADKGYDRADFVEPLRAAGITPHVASKVRGSNLDERTTRHAGYAISQRCRKKVEEIFGWMKTVGGFRRTRYRGRERTELCAYFVAAAYNLVRMSRLLANA